MDIGMKIRRSSLCPNVVLCLVAELWTIYVKRALADRPFARMSSSAAFHVPHRNNTFCWRAKVPVYEEVVTARIFLGPGVFIYFKIEGYDATLVEIKTHVKHLRV